MPLVLVTGISGAGKSAACVELQERGYEAHDTDLEGNAVWIHRETGVATAVHSPPERRPPEWLEQHEWRIVRHRVEALAERTCKRTVFLCGMTANQDDVADLFSRVIYLSIDAQTLRRRVGSRTTNEFGQAPHELAAILAWRDVVEERSRRSGAVIIDATRPLHQVVDDVLEAST
jgi:thymidylate kinase